MSFSLLVGTRPGGGPGVLSTRAKLLFIVFWRRLSVLGETKSFCLLQEAPERLHWCHVKMPTEYCTRSIRQRNCKIEDGMVYCKNLRCRALWSIAFNCAIMVTLSCIDSIVKNKLVMKNAGSLKLHSSFELFCCKLQMSFGTRLLFWCQTKLRIGWFSILMTANNRIWTLITRFDKFKR